MSIAVSVVEDNSIFRDSLVQLIHSGEELFLVSAYSNAEEAMAIITENPDIVIVDIELPGISGIELIRKLKPLHPTIEYLVCSAYVEDEKIFSALEAGASGYISKDCKASAITSAIRELYKGGSPMNASIARRVIASFQKKSRLQSFSLTPREKEILELAARGLQYKEIGKQLDISTETVKKHLKNIYQKMHVQNKIEAINKYRGL